MIRKISAFRALIAAALLTGTALTAGCGGSPEPTTRTTTTTEQIMRQPGPQASPQASDIMTTTTVTRRSQP